MDEYNVGSGMDSWPVPVLVITQKEKLVKLSQLPKALKQKAWAEIKTNCPPLADLLRAEALRETVERFDADIFIDAHLAPCLPPEPLRGRKT